MNEDAKPVIYRDINGDPFVRITQTHRGNLYPVGFDHLDLIGSGVVTQIEHVSGYVEDKKGRRFPLDGFDGARVVMDSETKRVALQTLKKEYDGCAFAVTIGFFQRVDPWGHLLPPEIDAGGSIAFRALMPGTPPDTEGDG